jgi:hypothetical protein
MKCLRAIHFRFAEKQKVVIVSVYREVIWQWDYCQGEQGSDEKQEVVNDGE